MVLRELPSSDSGISPLKSLLTRFSLVRLERLPSSAGISPLNSLSLEGQLYNAPVVVSGDALPFAEGRVAQPVVAFIPVLTVRCVVEGNQRFPVRFGGAGGRGGAVRSNRIGGSGRSRRTARQSRRPRAPP